MRVFEVAKEFNIPAESLIQLLREMGQTARSEASRVDDAAVAKLRARFERQKRSEARVLVRFGEEGHRQQLGPVGDEPLRVDEGETTSLGRKGVTPGFRASTAPPIRPQR